MAASLLVGNAVTPLTGLPGCCSVAGASSEGGAAGISCSQAGEGAPQQASASCGEQEREEEGASEEEEASDGEDMSKEDDEDDEDEEESEFEEEDSASGRRYPWDGADSADMEENFPEWVPGLSSGSGWGSDSSAPSCDAGAAAGVAAGAATGGAPRLMRRCRWRPLGAPWPALPAAAQRPGHPAVASAEQRCLWRRGGPARSGGSNHRNLQGRQLGSRAGASIGRQLNSSSSSSKCRRPRHTGKSWQRG